MSSILLQPDVVYVEGEGLGLPGHEKHDVAYLSHVHFAGFPIGRGRGLGSRMSARNAGVLSNAGWKLSGYKSSVTFLFKM